MTNTNKKEAIEKAMSALKKYSRRSNTAKELDKQIWNVVLANGCVNRLTTLTIDLENKYANSKQ